MLEQYNIKQLDYFDLYMPSSGSGSVAAMGAGQTGKTTLMMNILNNKFSSNKYVTTIYTLSSKIDAFKSLNENVILRSSFNCEDCKNIARQHKINEECDNKYMFAHLFDDILQEGNKNNDIINKLILFYRNQNISTYLSTQYPKLISRQNRCNINSVILFRFHQFDFIREVITNYLEFYFRKILGYNCSYEEMSKLYMEATTDHGFIYIVPFENRISFHKLSL